MYSDLRDISNHLDHSSHAKMGMKPFPDRLYVVTPISNPKRYNARNEHYRAFAKRVEDAGAILYTIEAAFGDREFEVTTPENPRHIQVRTCDEIWHKENLINLAIQRLPLEAKYVAWIDADMTFSRPDWAQETLHQLQHYEFVQMFSHVGYLGPNSEMLNYGISFMEGWSQGIAFKTQFGEARNENHWLGSTSRDENYGEIPMAYPVPEKPLGWCGAPGGAWAARRSALNAVGGLIDYAILGSGDYHMALGLFGLMGYSMRGGPGGYHSAYVDMLMQWQDLALRNIKKNVGHVPGTILHHWHGKMSQRGYGERWKVLIKHQFNPLVHLKRDSQGLYSLASECHQLRDDVRAYFGSRNEDGIEV